MVAGGRELGSGVGAEHVRWCWERRLFCGEKWVLWWARRNMLLREKQGVTWVSNVCTARWTLPSILRSYLVQELA